LFDVVQTRYVTQDEVSVAKPLGWKRLNMPTSIGGEIKSKSTWGSNLLDFMWQEKISKFPNKW
jgi:hypothetical protein